MKTHRNICGWSFLLKRLCQHFIIFLFVRWTSSQFTLLEKGRLGWFYMVRIVIRFTSIINFSCLHIIVFCFKKPFYCWYTRQLVFPPSLFVFTLRIQTLNTSLSSIAFGIFPYRNETICTCWQITSCRTCSYILTYSLLVLEMKDTF